MSKFKPARNALWGYSYQKCVTFMLVAKMDVERVIESIEIETDVEHNFDDAVIITNNEKLNCQMTKPANTDNADMLSRQDIVLHYRIEYGSPSAE